MASSTPKSSTKKTRKTIFDDDEEADFLKPTTSFDSVFEDKINWFPIADSEDSKGKKDKKREPEITIPDELKFQPPDVPEEEFKEGLQISYEGTQLSIVGQGLTEIPSDLAEKYPSTTNLNLTENSIRKVENIAKFTKLQTLILDANELVSEQDFPLLPELETLWVNNNKIDDIAVFLNSIAKAFPSLKYLSMLKNPACPNYFVGKEDDDYQRYRYYVLHRIKNLKFLDAKLVDANERKEAARVGHLMVVTRETKLKEIPQDSGPSPYGDLPQDLRKEGQAQATFGVCRYVYYGRQSEGNRFILNTDL